MCGARAEQSRDLLVESCACLQWKHAVSETPQCKRPDSNKASVFKLVLSSRSCQKMKILYLLSLLITQSFATSCGYDSCPKGKPNHLNVHLVPHTHDDVGWLKTVDQYYYGSNKYITTVGVQYILDTVIPELLMDPSKRFIYVEIAFFWRWWQEQDDRMRHLVKQLVQNGQLEFINGGWCMNDEASTHYNAIIDQMTWGFKRLNDTFGECSRPRIAWQIDPFGHSKEQASLFAEMGMDALFFGRLDYADKDKRLKEKSMEMMWQASDSLGKSSWLFTGALFNGYGPPDGFCFDDLCGDEPIMDDPRLHDYNKEQKVKDFIKAAEEQAKHYATNNIIMTMGSDFQYTNARVWFKNLDKLIKYVNEMQAQGSRVNAFYSTPSCYLKALNEADISWPSKTDDFFPYASDPHAYWTGYFTSRPALKGMVRQGNNFLQVCKQLGALTNQDWNPGMEGDLNKMREVMGVLQHHDAVSGTAKQHVTFDYAQRLAQGFAECDSVVSFGMDHLLPKTDEQEPDAPNVQFCHLLNITQCEITENSEAFVVNVYNPLARPVDKYVRLPVQDPRFQVQDPRGQVITSQVMPIPKPVLLIPGRQSKAGHELVFKAEQVPPLGFKSFYVSKTSGSNQLIEGEELDPMARRKKSIFGFQDQTKLVFNNKEGRLTDIIINGQVKSLEHTFGYYEGHPGNNSEFRFRASGAYIFRPTEQTPKLMNSRPKSTVFKGPLSIEVHQEFNEYISQVVRMYHGSMDPELEFLVGPIPISDGIGKEIISRYSTKVSDTQGTFYTDSNGRQMLKRTRNQRPTWKLNVTEPVAGNYYPVNSRMFIKDDKNQQVTLLTDRSQGGSSLQDGDLEIMIHRRLLFDDAFGVGEPLNESAYGQGLVVRGKHWIQYDIDGPAAASVRHRFKAQEIFMDTILSFIPTTLSLQDWKDKYQMEYSSLSQALPKNIHLLTLEEWTGNSRDSVLLRLEHIFEAHEDPQGMSEPASLKLENLFSAFDVIKVEEVTLGANLPKDQLQRLQWKVINEIPTQNEQTNSNVQKDSGFEVVLKPFQIRSFIIDLQAKS